METENKLEEAKYFFNRMKENIANPKVLGFNPSAFINAARSVTWFMQKEYSDNPRFKSWYVSKRKELEEDKVCKFFHDLRTANIHLEFPKFKRDIAVNL